MITPRSLQGKPHSPLMNNHVAILGLRRHEGAIAYGVVKGTKNTYSDIDGLGGRL